MDNMWISEHAFLDFENRIIKFVNQDDIVCSQKPFPEDGVLVDNLIRYLAENRTQTLFSIKDFIEGIYGDGNLTGYTGNHVSQVLSDLRDLLYKKDDPRRSLFLKYVRKKNEKGYRFNPPLDKLPPDDLGSGQTEKFLPDDLEQKGSGQTDELPSDDLESEVSGQPETLPPDVLEPEGTEQPDVQPIDDLNPEESGQTAAERLQLATDKLNDLIAEWARDVTGQSETLPPDNLEPEGSGQPDELPPVDLEPEESGQTDELPLDDLEPEEAEQTEKLPPIDFDPEGSGQLNVDTSKEKTAPQKNEKQSDDSAIPYSLRFMPERESLNIGFTIKIILISIVGILLYKNLVRLMVEVGDTGLFIRQYVPECIKAVLISMITVGVVGFFNKGNGQVIESLVYSKIIMRRRKFVTYRIAKGQLRRPDVRARTRIVRIVQRIILLSGLVLLYVLIQDRIDRITKAYIEIINERGSSSESSEVASEESTSEESVSEESVSEESVSEESVSEKVIGDFKLDKNNLILNTDGESSTYQLGVCIDDLHFIPGEPLDEFADNIMRVIYEGNLEWSSSDTTVATVSDGLVTAIGDGEATITVSYNEYSAVCDVSVKTDYYSIWSEWSEWTIEPITPSESLEVETRVWDEETVTCDMVSYRTFTDETMEVQYRNYSIGDNFESYGLEPDNENFFWIGDVPESALKNTEVILPGEKQENGMKGVNKAAVNGYSIAAGSVFHQIFFIENTHKREADKTYYRSRELTKTPVIYNND